MGVQVSSVGLTPEQHKNLQSIVDKTPGGSKAYQAGWAEGSEKAVKSGYKAPAPLVVTPESLAPVETPKLPEAPVVQDPGNILGGNNAALASMDFLKSLGFNYDPKAGFGTKEEGGQEVDPFVSSFQQYLGMTAQNQPPKTADLYEKAYNSAEMKQKRQAVQNYTSQINGIVNEAQAASLSVVGQGKGIPQAILNNQQAAINRRAAIQALPIQAQLAAASADLEQAERHLDTLFKLKSDDAQAQYQYRTNIINSVYQFANAQQQRALDAKKEERQRQFQIQMTNLGMQNEWSKLAVQTGQGNLVAQIAGLDTNAPDFGAKLGAITAKIQDPMLSYDIQLKKAQIAAANRSNMPDGSPKGTEAERQSAAIAKYKAVMVPGASLPDKTPILDPDGYITPVAWKEAINDAPSYGLSREAFIKNFGHLIYTEEGKVSPSYGLTPIEKQYILGKE